MVLAPPPQHRLTPSAAPSPLPSVPAMRQVFLVTSSLVLLSVLAQFSFAGVGAFHRPVDHDGFTLHAINSTVLLALVLLNTIVAALARAGGGTIALAALPRPRGAGRCRAGRRPRGSVSSASPGWAACRPPG